MLDSFGKAKERIYADAAFHDHTKAVHEERNVIEPQRVQVAALDDLVEVVAGERKLEPCEPIGMLPVVSAYRQYLRFDSLLEGREKFDLREYPVGREPV